MDNYENIAGSFMYISSPNSSIYKASVANPTSVSDQAVNPSLSPNQPSEVQDFHFGFIKINRARMFGMNRNGRVQSSKDRTGLYLSHIDKQLVSDYPNRMPLPLAPIITPILSGGSVPDGTYYFVVTAFGPQGTETTIGPETTVVVSGGGGSALLQVNIPTVAGATEYNLYGSTTSGVYVTPSLAAGGLYPPVAGGPVVLTLVSVAFDTGQPPSTSTQVDNSALATGDGTTATFSGTLPDVQSPLTVFYVQIIDGVETFTDNRSGLLIGSLGGTGTIDYVTGDYSVTFNTPPASGASITGAYYLEDATDGGVADFIINPSDTTNAAAQIFRQDDGGGLAQAVFPFNGVEYCLHVLRSWSLDVQDSSTGTVFDNEPYFEQIGIPFFRSAFPTGDGLLFLNNAKPQQPTVSILTIPPGSTNLTVVPVSLSDQLDLSGYGFDACVVFRAGDYDIMACRAFTNGLEDTFNDVCFIRNIVSGKWDVLDYTFSCLATYNGGVISGDSLSANLFELFSGFDDDGEVIRNYYKTSFQNLGIEGLKKCGYANLSGLIQKSQMLQVWYSLDNGDYVYVYTINGSGPYVSTTDLYTIGSRMIGEPVIGGGEGTGPDLDVQAGRYELDIPIHTDLFEYISVMVVAVDVGYVSVDRIKYKDIRFKRRKILPYDDLEINGTAGYPTAI
jgi:hypothetical protein